MEHLGGHRRLRQEQVRNLIINLGIGGCSHKCDTRAPMSLMYVRVNSVGEEARSCSPPVALVTDGTDISVWGGGGEGGRASGCRSPPTASPPAPTAGSPCRPSLPRGRAPPPPVDGGPGHSRIGDRTRWHYKCIAVQDEGTAASMYKKIRHINGGWIAYPPSLLWGRQI